MIIWPIFITGTIVGKIGGGMIQVITGRYIEETLRRKDYAIGMAFYHLSSTFAGFLGSWSSNLLPPDNDYKALKTSNTFRYLIAIG